MDRRSRERLDRSADHDRACFPAATNGDCNVERDRETGAFGRAGAIVYRVSGSVSEHLDAGSSSGASARSEHREAGS